MIRRHSFLRDENFLGSVDDEVSSLLRSDVSVIVQRWAERVGPD